MRKVIFTLIANLFIISSAIAASDSFSIKEYTLGMKLDSCPEASEKSKIEGKKITCILPATTYAGSPVKVMLLNIHSGELVTIGVMFNEKGSSALHDVLGALVERYGSPDVSKAHVNEYSWSKGNQTLLLDGWKGYLILSDMKKNKEISTQEAKSKQNDM